MKRTSKKFTQTWWTERLVPILLGLLLLALLATFAIIGLSALGLIPTL
jgi:hypothetical protein